MKLKRTLLSLLAALVLVTMMVATDYKYDSGDYTDDSPCEHVTTGFWLAYHNLTLPEGCGGGMEIYFVCGQPKDGGVMPCLLSGDPDGIDDAEGLLAIYQNDDTSHENPLSAAELFNGYRPVYCQEDSFGDLDCTIYENGSLGQVLGTIDVRPNSFDEDEMDLHIVPESATYTPTYGSACPNVDFSSVTAVYRRGEEHDCYTRLTSLAEAIWHDLPACVVEEEPEDTGDTGLTPEEITEAEAKTDLATAMTKYQGFKSEPLFQAKDKLFNLVKGYFEKWTWIIPTEEECIKRFHQSVILVSLIANDPTFAAEIEALVNDFLASEIDGQTFVRRVLRKLWKHRPPPDQLPVNQ